MEMDLTDDYSFSFSSTDKKETEIKEDNMIEEEDDDFVITSFNNNYFKNVRSSGKNALLPTFTHFPDMSPVPALSYRSPEYNKFNIHDASLCNTTVSLNEQDMSFSRPFSCQLPLPDQSGFDDNTLSSTKNYNNTPYKTPKCPPTPASKPSWRRSGKDSLSCTRLLLSLPDNSIYTEPSPEMSPVRPIGPLYSNKKQNLSPIYTNNGEDIRMDEMNCISRPISDEFEIISSVGSGSFAEVYKARSVKSKQLYAIKKSKREFRSERDRNNMLREIEMYEMLFEHHKNPSLINENIIRYYRAWQENGHLYMQIELCPLGNLKSFLDNHRNYYSENSTQIYLQHLPENCIWTIIRDVANGLKVIHQANMIHLDIKPANICIDNNGFCKIGDFGIAIKKKINNNNYTEKNNFDMEGDVIYMAKELLYNKNQIQHFDANIDYSVDIFSFGLLLFEMVTNISLPADGELWHQLRNYSNGSKEYSIYSMIYTYMQTNYNIYDIYSSDLLILIQEMLDCIPTKRPTATEILQHKKISNINFTNRSNYITQQHAIFKNDLSLKSFHNCSNTKQINIGTPPRSNLSFSWD